jgi:hypothetical protein
VPEGSFAIGVTLRIYIASTPYHLLLIGALQVGMHDTEAVVMYDDQYEFIAHSGSIAALFPNLRVEMLQPYDRSSRWARALRSRISANSILKRIKHSENPELYFCCPTRRDVLRVAHCIKDSVPVHFVEDGLDAYFPHGVTKPREGGHVQRYGARLINGFASPASFDATTVMKFQSFHLLFPEIRRPTIPLDQVERIEQSWLSTSVIRLRSITDKLTPAATPTDVWLPSLSVHISDISAFLASLEQQLAAVRAESAARVCAVKCHPREESPELLAGLGSLPVIQYPSWMPAELLLHRFDPSCIIRTGLSTFVLSSKIISPERVIWLDSSVSDEYADRLKRWDKLIGSAA